MPAISQLPVDGVIGDIVESLRRTRNLVLEAPPGAGKTTRVPPALLSLDDREILVLEPRRIAARMAARRVASEMGERVGDTVGYQVRFEDISGPRTRLRYITEGVLTRKLLSDPQLRRTGTVILDEFHERHLDADVGLALLRRLQVTCRPDLRIVVMSATLQAAPIAEYLETAVVRSEGRLFDIDVAYAGYSPAPLEQQVASALERVVTTGLDGDVLVFLPGAAEIRRAARSCDAIAQRARMLVCPLYGDLSPEEQDRAVGPADRPKLILSTNVAESSITIDGVTSVIDSGLARIASDSPDSGLPVLNVERISQASAIQRAGRAGRTRPGRAIRLYSLDDFVRRRAHDVPEIRRRELSQVVLELRALNSYDVPWFEPPPEPAIEAANDLLDRLDAQTDASALAALPLHPRLARLVLDCPNEEGCAAAALLSSGERIEAFDVLHALDTPPSPRVRQLASQLQRILKSRRRERHQEEQLRKAILRAYPDRVGRKQAVGSPSTSTAVQLSTGNFASIRDNWRSEFLVAVDIEERRETAGAVIRVASEIDPGWLLDFFPDRVREESEVIWNRQAERVESRSRMLYDSLVIEESRSGAVHSDAAAALLASQALDAGIDRFADPEELERFRARLEFASQHSGLKPLDDALIDRALRELSYGLKSFDELRRTAADGGFIHAVKNQLPREAQRELEEVAPDRVPLKGRNVKVNYVRGQQPWIASRLQDFFGLKQTPSIARGRAPLLVHLLAPNQRPVQVTADLAGFWERLYPQVRKELSRRYPKHSWPEKPV